jgi:hypothetical protein
MRYHLCQHTSTLGTPASPLMCDALRLSDSRDRDCTRNTRPCSCRLHVQRSVMVKACQGLSRLVRPKDSALQQTNSVTIDHVGLACPSTSLSCPSLSCPSLGCPRLRCPRLGCPRLALSWPCLTIGRCRCFTRAGRRWLSRSILVSWPSLLPLSRLLLRLRRCQSSTGCSLRRCCCLLTSWRRWYRHRGGQGGCGSGCYGHGLDTGCVQEAFVQFIVGFSQDVSQFGCC